MLSDFPKIQCPFIRKDFPITQESFKKNGNRLQLRQPKAYLVIDEINPGYEWVFDDPDTIAVEKLDGTNMKVLTKDGRLQEVQNRLNVIDPLQISKGKSFLVEGVLIAAAKGYINEDGEQAGECVGPKLQSNPYNLPHHIWYPFERTISHLRYKSFHKHDRTYDNFSSWFKDYLPSLFYCNYHKLLHLQCTIKAEGVIFYNLKRKAEGLSNMAKLRRDMFRWYYEPDIKFIDQ